MIVHRHIAKRRTARALVLIEEIAEENRLLREKLAWALRSRGQARAQNVILRKRIARLERTVGLLRMEVAKPRRKP